jgi:hypothetical protein
MDSIFWFHRRYELVCSAIGLVLESADEDSCTEPTICSVASLANDMCSKVALLLTVSTDEERDRSAFSNCDFGDGDF